MEAGGLLGEFADLALDRAKRLLGRRQCLCEPRLLREKRLTLPFQAIDQRLPRRDRALDAIGVRRPLLLRDDQQAQNEREENRQERDVSIKPDRRRGIISGHSLGVPVAA